MTHPLALVKVTPFVANGLRVIASGIGNTGIEYNNFQKSYWSAFSAALSGVEKCAVSVKKSVAAN